MVAALLLACAGEENARGSSSRGATTRNDSGGVPDPSTPGAAKTILALGTSLTAGLGLDPDSAWPAVLQRRIDSAFPGFVVRSAGVSGETSAGARRRIAWVLTDTANVVLIETGANDGLRGINPDSTRENIRSIVRAVRARLPQATIVLIGMRAPPNMGADYTVAFDAIFPRIAKEEGVELVPFLLDGVAGVAQLNQNDGIHPNVEGARRAAENVWRVLRTLLAAVR